MLAKKHTDGLNMMTEFTPDTIKIRQNMKKIEEKLEFTLKYLE